MAHVLMTLRSVTSSYIVFITLLVPVIALSFSVTIIGHDIKGLIIPISMTLLLLAIYSYFFCLRFTLSESAVIYRVWRAREVRLNDIQRIDRGRGPFGVGVTWIIHRRKSSGKPVVANMTNFDPHLVRDLAAALLQISPDIKLSAIPIARR